MQVLFRTPVSLVPEAPMYSWLRKTKADTFLIGKFHDGCLEFWIEVQWRLHDIPKEEHYLGKCRMLDFLRHPVDVILNALSHYWFAHTDALVPTTFYKDYLEELMLQHKYRDFSAVHSFLEYQTQFVTRIFQGMLTIFESVNFIYDHPPITRANQHANP